MEDPESVPELRAGKRPAARAASIRHEATPTCAAQVRRGAAQRSPLHHHALQAPHRVQQVLHAVEAHHQPVVAQHNQPPLLLCTTVEEFRGGSRRRAGRVGRGTGRRHCEPRSGGCAPAPARRGGGRQAAAACAAATARRLVTWSWGGFSVDIALRIEFLPAAPPGHLWLPAVAAS